MAKRETNSKEVDLIVIRFAGDSGDGMQLTKWKSVNYQFSIVW